LHLYYFYYYVHAMLIITYLPVEKAENQ